MYFVLAFLTKYYGPFSMLLHIVLLHSYRKIVFYNVDVNMQPFTSNVA